MSTEVITFQPEDLPSNLELLFDAAIVINRDGTIISVNGQACYLFGYDMDEMIGKALDLLLPERLRENHHRHRKHYFAAPTSRTMGTGLHLYGKKRDGSEFPIDVGLRPILINAEPHALAVIRDKTEIIAVQAVFEQRLATFTSLTTSVEELKKMIAAQVSPIGNEVALIKGTIIPQIVTRVDRMEESVNEFNDQWKEVKPTFERIDRTFEVADGFMKLLRRAIYAVGGVILASVAGQFVIYVFHLFGH